MLKHKYIFQKIYGNNLSNSTRKLLWFEITKMLIAVKQVILLSHLLQFSAHFRSLYATSTQRTQCGIATNQEVIHQTIRYSQTSPSGYCLNG